MAFDLEELYDAIDAQIDDERAGIKAYANLISIVSSIREVDKDDRSAITRVLNKIQLDEEKHLSKLRKMRGELNKHYVIIKRW